MIAKIKLTVGGKEFRPGETITKKIGATDEAFLLREGYIEKEGVGTKAEAKPAKKEKGGTPQEAV